MLKFKDSWMDGQIVELLDSEIQSIRLNNGKILVENTDGLFFETEFIERIPEVEEAVNDFIDCCEGKKEFEVSNNPIVNVEMLPYGNEMTFADGTKFYYSIGD